jgi:hypothetical protein
VNGFQKSVIVSEVIRWVQKHEVDRAAAQPSEKGDCILAVQFEATVDPTQLEVGFHPGSCSGAAIIENHVSGSPTDGFQAYRPRPGEGIYPERVFDAATQDIEERLAEAVAGGSDSRCRPAQFSTLESACDDSH